MKILHAISGIWEHTGGPAESVPRLCSALVKRGIDVSIMTLNGELSNAALESQSDGVKIISFPHYNQMSLNIFSAAMRLTNQCDIVHGHGLWLPLNWAAGRAAIKNRKPLIVTPRGSLNPAALNHSRRKKKMIGTLFDNQYLRAASCIHVTSNEEHEAIRQYGLKNPVALIPNGVQGISYDNLMSEHAFKQKYGLPARSRILLFLSRISWEKGLEDLAEAWSRVAVDQHDWQLVVVGPGKPEYITKLKQIFANSHGADRVSWLGSLDGSKKAAAYAAAELFILPSHTENFSLVTAEALAAGVPVITTQGTPWSSLPHNGCGWWVPVGADGLTLALGEALRLNKTDLVNMGERGKTFIGEKYTWPVIAKQMLEVYEWVLGDSNMPSCVITD